MQRTTVSEHALYLSIGEMGRVYGVVFSRLPGHPVKFSAVCKNGMRFESDSLLELCVATSNYLYATARLTGERP